VGQKQLSSSCCKNCVEILYITLVNYAFKRQYTKHIAATDGATNSSRDVGCFHIYTSTSTGTRVRVPGNIKFNAIHWQPFTFVRVVYESELPVNSTCTGPVCTGPVFQQLVQADVDTVNKNGDEVDD